jgi:hypothetical protein
MTPAQIFDEKLRKTLDGCSGETVAEVWIDEMGLYGPDECPSFTHSQLEFVQAYRLELRFESGRTLKVDCFQDGHDFALRAELISTARRLKINNDPERTLFRVRPMDEFPRGKIQSVDWDLDEYGNMQVIRFGIGAAQVLLCAGEVYEDWGDKLMVGRCDESVLIFLDPTAYERTVFGEYHYTIE